jgi:hypothetical protein
MNRLRDSTGFSNSLKQRSFGELCPRKSIELFQKENLTEKRGKKKILFPGLHRSSIDDHQTIGQHPKVQPPAKAVVARMLIHPRWGSQQASRNGVGFPVYMAVVRHSPLLRNGRTVASACIIHCCAGSVLLGGSTDRHVATLTLPPRATARASKL